MNRRSRVRRWVVGVALICGFVGTGVGSVSSAAASAVCVLCLSPTGSDTNNGLSMQAPLKTLARAQERLRALQPTTDVEIRIEQGVYVAAPLSWNAYVFRPHHQLHASRLRVWRGSERNRVSTDFRGDGTTGNWLDAVLPAGHPGGATGLRFYYLRVERYDKGLSFFGGLTTNSAGITVPSTAGMNHNTVYGRFFQWIGSRHAGIGGTSAIALQNSSDNLIRNNHFVEVESAADSCPGCMHALYMAHHNNRNQVTFNRFQTVSGDAIRARNDSNNNIIDNNTFDDTGNYGAYSDWFCDLACVEDNPGHARECASHGTFFRWNTIGDDYRGNGLNAWALFPPDQDATGGPGCSNGSAPRLRTVGNVHS